MDNFYISLFPCKCPETLRQIYMFGDISLRLWIRKNDRKTKEAVRFITFTLICWDQCREKQTMCRRLGRYFRDNNVSCPHSSVTKFLEEKSQVMQMIRATEEDLRCCGILILSFFVSDCVTGASK